VRAGIPQHGGDLLRLTGPARIESGWWQQGESQGTGDIQRDYFVAATPRREWLWIFRDTRGWWLQGVFA
jgi:protein ImuB